MLRLSAFGLLLLSTPAFAHGGEEHGGWSLDPWVAIPVALLLFVYLVGYRRFADRAGHAPPGRGRFLGGWAVLAFALLSPLHEAGERSFTMHMIEHELIMLIATAL